MNSKNNDMDISDNRIQELKDMELSKELYQDILN